MNPSEKSILCGTDFSPNAIQATTAAAALAQRWNKALVLLHVADELNVNAQPPERLEAFLEPLRARLQEESVRLAATGAAVSGVVLHGDLAESAILAFAEKHPADLVVLSAVSKTAFDRWTVGSVSERIAEAAPTATLVVRSAAPFEAWTRGERPLRVFVAADFCASTDAALRWIAELRKLGPCEVTAGYVNWPPEERHRLGIRGPESFNENLPEVQRVLERDLREKVVGVLGEEGVAVRVRASWGRVEVPLIDLAREADADLFVVGTHQRRGLERWTKGSVSRAILRHAPMNVACVPTAAVPAPAPTVLRCRRVLVAADLQPDGALALPSAYSVVPDGGTVCVVHVAKPGGADGATDAAPLRAMIPTEAKARGVETEVKTVRNADVVLAICQAAEAFGADIVCIGAHARPGITSRVMGSVALGVLQHCRRPVLVVWPPVE